MLYGRRRAGKTELLGRFAANRRALVFEATDVRRDDQLRDFGTAYVDAFASSGIIAQVPSWDVALDMLATASATERTLVVLDEFQYLVGQEPGLGSQLASWWRTTGSAANVVVVLAGSDLSFFADDVLGVTAPLHGRRTAEHPLLPFSARDAALFFPSWTAVDRIRAFAVWGGAPYYLDLLEEAQSLEENIFGTILRPGAPLLREAEYLVRMESRLRDVALYGSILRGIARGATTLSQIAGHLGGGADTGNLARQLARLEDVGLARQLRPVTRARKTSVRYEICDPFLRFWHRFVAPAAGRLVTFDGARRYLERVVRVELDSFVAAPAFEEICQAHLRDTFDAAAAGRWWGPITETDHATGQKRTVQREADGVALADDGSVAALATCKWTNAAVDVSELRKLRRIAAELAPGRAVPIVVYSRSGIDERIERESEREPDLVRHVTPAGLYR